MSIVEPKRTSLGDRGEAVLAWQQFLASKGFSPGTIDGIHGRRTEEATLAYLKASKSPPPMPFMQAKNYRKANRTTIDWVVLHSTENPIRVGTAKAVARYFEGPNAPQASAHYVVGPEEVWQCVLEKDIAFAAPGANQFGIQVEMVGQAAKTDWLLDGRTDVAGLEVVQRTARLVSSICDRWQIPKERVDADGLHAKKRGITTHASVTAAFKISTHIDPGMERDRRWPWDRFLELVRRG